MNPARIIRASVPKKATVSMMFQTVKIAAFLIASLVWAFPILAAPGNSSKPNIVLVLMDNFGYGEVGVYGGGILRGAATPKIDGLAEEGARFTNYNVEAECTPSRAALLTGRYGIRTRLMEDGSPPRDIWYGITKYEYTLAEMLSDSGYATGMFGKWHLGDTEGRYPTDQGFDEWYGIPRSSDRSHWPDSTRFIEGVHPAATFTRIMTAKKGEKPKEGEVYGLAQRATIDRELTDHAIDFIKRKAKAKQPFFAYLPLYANPRAGHPPSRLQG
jgi:arylsulfatase A-like enzyme